MASNRGLCRSASWIGVGESGAGVEPEPDALMPDEDETDDESGCTLLL